MSVDAEGGVHAMDARLVVETLAIVGARRGRDGGLASAREHVGFPRLLQDDGADAGSVVGRDGAPE